MLLLAPLWKACPALPLSARPRLVPAVVPFWAMLSSPRPLKLSLHILPNRVRRDLPRCAILEGFELARLDQLVKPRDAYIEHLAGNLRPHHQPLAVVKSDRVNRHCITRVVL